MSPTMTAEYQATLAEIERCSTGPGDVWVFPLVMLVAVLGVAMKPIIVGHWIIVREIVRSVIRSRRRR